MGMPSRRWAAIAVVAAAVCGCSLVGPPAPTPEPADVQPVPGPVDKALLRLDPDALIKTVPGGAACRHGGFFDAGGAHLLRAYECPRNGDDRTLYFLFADAWEATLEASGATLGGGGMESGDASAPIARYSEVAGETLTGTSRLLGVNGPGTLTLYLSLDLVGR